MRVVLAASLLVPAALFIFAAHHSRSDAYADAERNTVQTVRLLEAHALRLIEAKEQVLRRVDERLRGMSWDAIAASVELHEEFKAIRTEFPERISIVAADGNGSAHLSSEVHPVRNIDISARSYFQALRDADTGTYVSEVIRGMVSGEPSFAVARRRTTPDGGFDGVVIVSLYPAFLSSLYETTKDVPASAVALFREDGVVLARSPDIGPIRYPPDSSVMVGVLAGQASGVFTSVSPVDGTERLAAWRKVGEFPLYVALGASTAALEARWRQGLVDYGLTLVATALGLFFMSWIALREVHRQQALKTALRAGNEDLEKRVAARTAELLESNRNLNLLLKEVHHRVKNNLQIVSSFLGIQSRRLPAEYQGIYKESLSRIQTMSLIHETLYGIEQFAHVNLQALLPKLVDRLMTLYDLDRDRVVTTVDGTTPELELEEAIPIALIANEVISNAFKHAFPDNRSGAIRIRIDGDEACFRLTIADDGVGFVSELKAGPGIGVRMINGLCTQIGAACHWHGDNGTRFELVLDRRRPLASVA